jgi:hypothetical protein
MAADNATACGALHASRARQYIANLPHRWLTAAQTKDRISIVLVVYKTSGYIVYSGFACRIAANGGLTADANSGETQP